MRSHTSTSTYSSLSASESSQSFVRRFIRHSSLEAINTKVSMDPLRCPPSPPKPPDLRAHEPGVHGDHSPTLLRAPKGRPIEPDWPRNSVNMKIHISAANTKICLQAVARFAVSGEKLEQPKSCRSGLQLSDCIFHSGKNGRNWHGTDLIRS